MTRQRFTNDLLHGLELSVDSPARSMTAEIHWVSTRFLRFAVALALFTVMPPCRAQETGKQPAADSVPNVTTSPKSFPVPPEFTKLDVNADGSLQEAEFLAGRPNDQLPKWKRDFRVMNLDQNTGLSVSEFSLSLPLTADSPERGTVPDPIQGWMEARLAALLKVFHSADSDKNGMLTTKEWSATPWIKVLPEFESVDPAVWDRDRDESITESECRFLLELAYGIRRSDGLPLRTATGFVVNWPYLRSLDKNGDGSWSQDEIVSKYWGGPEKGAVVFQKLDVDGNGEASAEEVWKGQIFYRDIFKQFLEFDKNVDGEVDEPELLASVTPLQRVLASHVIKAFDSDSNGKLSLVEFRTTPIANPVSDWHVARTDRNTDGKLSESEFYLDTRPFLLSLSAEFFLRFDRNHDRVVVQNELSFTTTAVLPAPQVTFESQDRNSDGKLTLDELIAEAAPKQADPAALKLHRQKRSYCRNALMRAARNDEGYLTKEQYEKTAIAFRPVVMNQVLSLDRDGNDLVSQDEYLELIPEADKSAAARDLIVMDFDHDLQLTGLELSRIPNRFPAGDRAAIPDPIVDWMEARLATLMGEFRRIDTDHDGSITPAQWPAAKWSLLIPALHGMNSDTWDQDRNGQISEAECRLVLEITDGIRRRDGLPFRLPTGHVINWPFLRNLDQNGDQIWSKDEFIPKFWSGPEKGATVFQDLDTDMNGQLSLKEIWNSPVFFRDIVRLFYDFDKNLDGFIDQPELIKGVTPAQRPLSYQLSQYYDLDGNQKLDLYEFRASPIANIMADWHLPRFDLDFDGKLSEAEFYCEKMPLMLGLSHEYFQRYDGNQDGFITYGELLYFIDYQKVPAEVSFQFKDQNLDQQLTLKELMHEIVPPQPKPFDPSQQEQALMEATKRFGKADADQDGTLDFAEYQTTLVSAGQSPMVADKSDKPAIPMVTPVPKTASVPNNTSVQKVSDNPGNSKNLPVSDGKVVTPASPTIDTASALETDQKGDHAPWSRILLGVGLIAIIGVVVGIVRRRNSQVAP